MQAQEIRSIFCGDADFEEHLVYAGAHALTVFFLDGLTSGSDLADFVIRPLHDRVQPGSESEVYAQIKNGAVCCAAVCETKTAEQTAEKMLFGYCAVVFEHLQTALCFEVKTPVKRGPDRPDSENTVKGAKDAFTETIRINTSLVRRHIRSTDLRIEQQLLGTNAKTNVTLCYLHGVTKPEYVTKMRARLKELSPDALVSPAAVEELITGSRRTAFGLLQFTERTDKFCQGLLSGQVGLLIDGLPEGYLAPVSIGRLMQSPEDRAVDYISATFVRILRYLALFASLFLPAVYAAMAMYHQQMLPTELLRSIIESKQNVPFSTILEVLGLLTAFEILQEAGLHLPHAIGTSVSIIGGLVVGTAAVDAKLVSPAALIVAASAGICGFALPDRDLADAVRLWRFALTLFAGFAGLFGVSVGALLLLLHLAQLTSLDDAFLSPFSSVNAKGAIVRPLFRKGGSICGDSDSG